MKEIIALHSEDAEKHPHAANLRAYRAYGRPGSWFVTKCVEPRCPVLCDKVATHIADAFRWYAEQGVIHVGAFVVMPDHWHLLFHAGDDVSKFMKTAVHWISRKTSPVLGAAGVRWQDGFHETRIRSARQFHYVRRYIEDNPVKKALAGNAGDWRWSSASDQYKDVVPVAWPFEFEEEREAPVEVAVNDNGTGTVAARSAPPTLGD